MSSCSRLSAIQMIDEVIDLSIKKTLRLQKLKEYLTVNEIPNLEVDEALWTLLSTIRGNYYL